MNAGLFDLLRLQLSLICLSTTFEVKNGWEAHVQLGPTFPKEQLYWIAQALRG